ncbi:MAG: hypothetical protein PV344_04705 [Anaplasma sp.]|nr:hypothetical protein [Anaplasma sp.]
MELFAGSNFHESNMAAVVFTYCPNCSWDLFFTNRRRFAKFKSSQKFCCLQ